MASASRSDVRQMFGADTTVEDRVRGPPDAIWLVHRRLKRYDVARVPDPVSGHVSEFRRHALWSGVLRGGTLELRLPRMSELLDLLAGEPQRTAIASPDRDGITYADLARQCTAIGRQLRGAGVGPRRPGCHRAGERPGNGERIRVHGAVVCHRTAEPGLQGRRVRLLSQGPRRVGAGRGCPVDVARCRRGDLAWRAGTADRRVRRSGLVPPRRRCRGRGGGCGQRKQRL